MPATIASRKVANPKRRMALVVFAIAAVLVLIVVKLVSIQGMDTAKLAEQALDSRLVNKTLPAKRGSILAADGTVLADNARRFKLVADPVNVAAYKDENGQVVGAWGAANEIATVLNTDPGLIYPKLKEQGEKRWSPIADGLTSEVWVKIRELKIPGITVEESSVRTYPAGEVAGNIVGFVGSDGEALTGVERQYRHLLTGKDGKEQYERGLSGDPIPLGSNSQVPPVDGTGLQLTIDTNIQMYAQNAIGEAVKKHKAEWGSVVIQEAGTGRILAAAESPTVDPNNPGKSKAEDRGSRTFTSNFEPGSTAKLITTSALIETGKATADSQYVVPDKWKAPNGEVFRDSHNHADQNLTLAGILMDSSNTGTLIAAEGLNNQERYEWLKKFGFGTPPELEFPGTSRGILRHPKSWDGRTEHTVMFGQGVAATALQTTQAFSIIADDGMAHPQRIVNGTVDPTGKVTEIPLKDGTQVVKPQTAQSMREILEAVVEDGTGSNAKVPGYRVGGKTGTAQAPADKGGGFDGYTASFIGIAPIDDPKITVSVTLQRPRKGHYGGAVAAPVFSDVTGYALKQMRVPPSGPVPELPAREWKNEDR